MKKIFLTSSGLDNEAVIQAFLKYVGKKPKDIKLAFIPTAADPEPDKSFVQWTIDELKAIGITPTRFDLKDSNPGVIKKMLSHFDVILVNGGNTFYLLQEAHRSGFVDVIIEILENTGRVYVGVSAGSLLAGPSIEASGWKPGADRNIVKLKDLTGTKLVNFTVFPHFKSEQEKILSENSKKIDYQILALKDGEAVYTDENEKLVIIGEGKWLGK